MNEKIDKKDQMLLDALHEDASASTYKLGKRTGIPQTTVLHRVRKLRESGVITRYTVELDYKKLDKKVKALIFIRVDKNKEKQKYGKVGGIESRLLKHQLVLGAKRLMGTMDIVLEVIACDVDELNQFLVNNVRSLDEIAETQTVIVLDEWKK